MSNRFLKKLLQLVIVTFLISSTLSFSGLKNDFLEGKWKIVNATIALTSFKDEKENFYFSCINRKVSISSKGNLRCDKCDFFMDISSLTLITENKISVVNPPDSINDILLRILPKQNPEIYTIAYQANNGDILTVFRLSEDSVILWDEPYILTLKRCSGR